MTNGPKNDERFRKMGKKLEKDFGKTARNDEKFQKNGETLGEKWTKNFR